jgi:hypothetical protein
MREISLVELHRFKGADHCLWGFGPWSRTEGPHYPKHVHCPMGPPYIVTPSCLYLAVFLRVEDVIISNVLLLR